MTDPVHEWRQAAYKATRERDEARAVLAGIREYVETSDDDGIKARETVLRLLDDHDKRTP